MSDKKFDPKKLAKLNNPQRLIDIPPAFIRDRLTNRTPQTLVEIGAGTAFFCVALLQELKPQRIYACDLSPTMIDWMRENVIHEYPAIVPVQTTEERVPLNDGCADLLFMINLHHELDQPESTLIEAERLLQPGGEIVIVDWKKKEMEQGPPEKIRCTPEQVTRELQSAGFVQIESHNDLEKHFLMVARKQA